jgi:hypothetical protein
MSYVKIPKATTMTLDPRRLQKVNDSKPDPKIICGNTRFSKEEKRRGGRRRKGTYIRNEHKDDSEEVPNGSDDGAPDTQQDLFDLQLEPTTRSRRGSKANAP